jgi:hypothetical protein
MSGSEKLFECVTKIRNPTRWRGPVLDDISGSPCDAAFVDGARSVVIGAKDIKIAE